MYLPASPHMPGSLRPTVQLSFADTRSPHWPRLVGLRDVGRVFGYLWSVALVGAMLVAASCTAFGAEDVRAPAGRLPNIVVILADDLGYGDVGCYNPESKVPTPNLDKLAAQGMRFTDAHSAATVCTPSRYSLLTGRMCFRTGMRGVFTGAGGPCLIEEGRLTLPQMLRNKGYATACVGKWHVGLTFFDKQGRPIHQNGLESGSTIRGPSPMRRSIGGSTTFSAPPVARAPTGSMPISKAIAFRCRRPNPWTAAACPSIPIPTTIGRA